MLLRRSPCTFTYHYMGSVYTHLLCLSLTMLALSICLALHPPGTIHQELYHSQVDAPGSTDTSLHSSVVNALVDAVALPAVPRPWVGLHNKLEQLAAVRSATNTVTFTIFTSLGYLGMLKNWLYAITTYGRVDNYIIVCSHAHALETCLDLALPCYNLTMLAGQSSLAVPFNASKDGEAFNTPSYNRVTFQRVLVADVLFELGYNVFQSDVDTVYIKDAFRTLDTAVTSRGADAVFMLEGPLNGGNWYARNTPEIRNLFKEWLNSHGGNFSMHDQAKLSSLNGKFYRTFDSRSSCTAARNDRLAPIYAHPIPMKKNFCVYHPFDDDPCDPRRLYLHAVCKVGIQTKVNWFTSLGIWFVDERTHLKSRAEISRQAPWLPCKTDTVTWATQNM